MNTAHKWVFAVVVLALVAMGGYYLAGSQSYGGQYEEYEHKWFQRGLTIGDDSQTVFDREGVLTSSAAVTLTGATAVAEFTQGGGVLSIDPVDATLTLTAAQLASANVITFPASSTQPALTVTLPATSTMTSLLPNAGDYRSWVIENPFLGAATTTTIAAGTGIDLQEPDGQNVVIEITNYAWLTCYRKVSTDVVCSVDESIPAD
jgi:hypothetical protein